MEFHEVCSIFPMMSDEEFAGLKADIEAHGQREPVWSYQGKVIDGRNRLRACQELGREPLTKEWDGDGSLIEFVVSLNLHRRHLSSGQRAACGTEIEERLAIEAKQRQAEQARRNQPQAQSQKVALLPPIEKAKARDQAAKLVGSNPRYIQDAKAVKAAAPELHEKVKAGRITLPQARREVQRQEKRAALEAKARTVQGSPERSAWEIRVGDCIDVIKSMEVLSARLVFADPPYNIGIDYGDHHDDAMSDGQFIAWSSRWIKAAARTLAPDGSMWVLIGDEYADHYGILLREAGLHRRAWIKWYESFGVNASNNFNRCSRHLFYCVKDARNFVFNPDVVNRPSDRQVKYGDGRADPGGKLWDDVWGVNPPIPRLVGNAAERIPDFPTQLPLSLLLPIVGCASDPGDLVIDPFNGSGTTGEAALRLGRRYLGIEKSSRFAGLARMRLTVAEASASPSSSQEGIDGAA
jgi:DNA modification methylase